MNRMNKYKTIRYISDHLGKTSEVDLHNLSQEANYNSTHSKQDSSEGMGGKTVMSLL